MRERENSAELWAACFRCARLLHCRLVVNKMQQYKHTVEHHSADVITHLCSGTLTLFSVSSGPVLLFGPLVLVASFRNRNSQSDSGTASPVANLALASPQLSELACTGAFSVYLSLGANFPHFGHHESLMWCAFATIMQTCEPETVPASQQQWPAIDPQPNWLTGSCVASHSSCMEADG